MLNQTNKSFLLIDIGNSSLKWMLSGSNGLTLMSQEYYPDNVSCTFLKKTWRGLESPSAIFVSCVAHDDLWLALEKACHELWDVPVHRVNAEKESFGVVNAYADVSSLGSDRWYAMIGARDITHSDFMVIDAGSALTIDVVNSSGKHQGGYIVPGLGMMKQSLGLNTAQVQVEISEEYPSLSLGNSTASCVTAGLHLSAVKFIEAVVEQELEQKPEYEIFITGGDAVLLKHFLSIKCVIIPDLVLRGLSVDATSSEK